MSKRDELAKQHVLESEVPMSRRADSFKAGWDACEREMRKQIEIEFALKYGATKAQILNEELKEVFGNASFDLKLGDKK